MALLLLKTSPRSWYSSGTVDTLGGGYMVGLDVDSWDGGRSEACRVAFSNSILL